jgi:hypothetical protein
MRFFYRLAPLALAAAAALSPAVTPGAEAQILPKFGEDRAGTAGFLFLRVPADPRTAALGESVAAGSADATALFHNPALTARAGRHGATGGVTRYYADTQLFYAGAYTTLGGFTLGLSTQAFSSGDMAVTTEFDPDGSAGQTFAMQSGAVGLTAGQALTDLFSYGVTVKYAVESVAEVQYDAFLADLGVFYRIGETGVQLGMAIRDFGLDGTPSSDLTRPTLDGPQNVEDLTNVTAPTTFLLGVGYRVPLPSSQHDLQLLTQLVNPNDNAERFNIGAEYTFARVLTLRGGYQVGREFHSVPSLGFGVQAPGFGPEIRADYGFTRHDLLGSVHRVGVTLGLD